MKLICETLLKLTNVTKQLMLKTAVIRLPISVRPAIQVVGENKLEQSGKDFIHDTEFRYTEF